MQEAFTIVLFVVVGVGIVGALVTLVLTSRAYDEIGRGGLFREDGAPPAGAGAMLTAGEIAERDAEIRQMLTARNTRRAARGDAPIDVEDELARLTAPVIDDELAEEIRALVIASNRRRERRGEEPLDVDAEVARRVRELEGG